MRLFSNEYSLPHPWNTVTAASWQKYPNPEWTPHVTNVDYLSRQLDLQGRLVTERLLTCQQSVPSVFTRLIGLAECPPSLVYERSVVDPAGQEMAMETRNLSFSHLIVLEEACKYKSLHGTCTAFSQECRIKSVHGWSWIAGHIEDFCVSRFQANAHRGRKALEEAIERIEEATACLVEKAGKLWCEEANNA